MHQYMPYLINKTPSEAGLAFASCLCILQPSATILFLPLARVADHISLHLSLCFPTQYLSPLVQSQFLSSFQRPHTLQHTNTRTETHPQRHAKPFHLPGPRSPHSTSLLSSRCFPSCYEIHISTDTSPGCTNRIFSRIWN